MAKTVLVTGASGFLGGRLVEVLAAEGHRVRGLVRTPARAGHLAGIEGLEVIRADLADRAALEAALDGVVRVFHCAANVRPWGRWEDYLRDNVHGTRNLVAACVAATPGLERFVHVSTVDVYGYPEDPADETAPVSPGDFGYGRSKALAEDEVRRLGASGIPFTILRPGNVFGPRGQFVTEVGDGLRSRVMLMVNGGRAHAGLIYVDNLVTGLLAAAESPRAAGETFNMRDACDVTWRQYLDRLADGIGAPRCALDLSHRRAWALAVALEAPHRWLGLRSEPLLHRLLVLMLSRTCGHPAAKARAVLGDFTRVPFDQAMERSVAWYRARLEGAA